MEGGLGVSYDLLLMRFRSQVETRRSWEMIRVADLDRNPGGAIDLDRLSRRLRAIIPGLEGAVEGEAVRLSAPGWGQIVLSGEAASIKLPYRHDGPAARRMITQLWQVLRLLRREAGLQACDPQLGRVLDLERDQQAVLREYERGLTALLSMLAPGELALR